MTKPRIRRPHTSRRASGPKDSDYDHEISLVEEDTARDGTVSPQHELPDPGLGPSSSPRQRPLSSVGRRRSSASRHSHSSGESRPVSPKSKHGAAGTRTEPTIAIEQPTPFERPVATMPHAEGAAGSPPDMESAIDILYENERGALCCGYPLFASQALGNLDPPAWTNVAHKPSPTDIRTAQVPDPSWDWAWPEWRVNHEDGADKDGWEYSFAFYKKFSWHGPKWWNSFVRRRAWIRRRVKKDQIRQAHGGSLLQPEYFTVRSSAEMARRRSSAELSGAGAGSKRTSMVSASLASHSAGAATAGGEGGEALDIRDVNELLVALRACRIDREKIEALENYLENGEEDDLANLAAKMPEVMAFFVFQTSRRVLVARLTELHDQAAAEVDQGAKKDTNGNGNEPPSSRVKAREAALAAALRHADEEVKRLEYWSDVKEVAEKGHTHGAVDGECGWDDTWEGVDNSGPAAPNARERK